MTILTAAKILFTLAFGATMFASLVGNLPAAIIGAILTNIILVVMCIYLIVRTPR